MKKKILSVFIIMSIIIPCMCLFTACGEHKCDFVSTWTHNNTHHWRACKESNCDKTTDYAEHSINNNTCSICGYVQTSPSPQSITVTFTTTSGTLSKTSQSLNLVNGQAFLNENTMPTLSGESNNVIFDYWATTSGTRFDFTTPLTENITLKIVFAEAERVWAGNWDLHDNPKCGGSLLSELYRTIGQASITRIGNTVRTDNTHKSATFQKIKSSDCLDSYITYEEYEDLPTNVCFITSNSFLEPAKYVTTSDITTDTYLLKYIAVFGDSYYCSQKAKYLPKGFNAFSLGNIDNEFNVVKSIALWEDVPENYYLSGYSRIGDQYSLVCLNETEFFALTKTQFDTISSASQATNTSDNFQSDKYYMCEKIEVAAWTYSSTNSGLETIYNYATVNLGQNFSFAEIKQNVTKAEYDALYE